tara:strand:+ start:185 stop:712 length:528 start_codon:yes stop_codon:yes gene_type:complete
MAIDPSISRNNLNRLREAAIRSALDNVVDDEGDKIQASRTLMAKSPEVKDTAEIKSASSEVQRRLERIYAMEKDMLDPDVATKDYVVQAGDTLTDIAEATGTTIGQMIALNDLKDKDSLAAGQVIKVKKVADLSVIPDILDALQTLGGSGLGQLRELAPLAQPAYDQMRNLFRKT